MMPEYSSNYSVASLKNPKGSVLKEEFNRALFNPRWIGIFLLSGLMVAFGNYRWGMVIPHPVNRVMMHLSFGDYDLLAPILSTLPFADSFINEQGFGRLILHRTHYRKYLGSKALAVFLSGGLYLALILMLMLGINSFSGADWSSREFISNGPSSIVQGPFGETYHQNPLFYFAYLLVINFLVGGCFALLGLALSALVSNRYVALVAPLVVLQLWGFLVLRIRSLNATADPLACLKPWYGIWDAKLEIILPSQIALVLIMAMASLILYGLVTRTRRSDY